MISLSVIAVEHASDVRAQIGRLGSSHAQAWSNQTMLSSWPSKVRRRRFWRVFCKSMLCLSGDIIHPQSHRILLV